MVGKAQGKYTIDLEGWTMGTRLAFVFREMVPLNEIHEVVMPVFLLFRSLRLEYQAFGDFCHRLGKDKLDRLLSEKATPTKSDLTA